MHHKIIYGTIKEELNLSFDRRVWNDPVASNFTGKVQGVGFRYFSQMKAVQYGVTGWASNLSNNSVEIVALGTRDQLQPFYRRPSDWKSIFNHR